MISMFLDCRQREHHVKIWARLRSASETSTSLISTMYKTCGFNVIFDEWDKGRMTRYRLLAAILGRGMQQCLKISHSSLACDGGATRRPLVRNDH